MTCMKMILIHAAHVAVGLLSLYIHSIVTNLHAVVVLLVIAIGWRLSRGESFLTRLIRLGLTLALLAQIVNAIGTGNEMYRSGEGLGIINKEDFIMAGLRALACLLPLMFLWISNINELMCDFIWKFVDGQGDSRPIKDTRKESDALAALVREGRTAAAIRMAKRLKKSGNHSHAALDAMIYRLKTPTPSKSNLLETRHPEGFPGETVRQRSSPGRLQPGQAG